MCKGKKTRPRVMRCLAGLSLMKDAGAGRGDVGTYCRRRPPARVLKLHGGLGRVAGGRWYVHITQDLVDALGRPFSDFSFSFILRNHRGREDQGAIGRLVVEIPQAREDRIRIPACPLDDVRRLSVVFLSLASWLASLLAGQKRSGVCEEHQVPTGPLARGGQLAASASRPG